MAIVRQGKRIGVESPLISGGAGWLSRTVKGW